MAIAGAVAAVACGPAQPGPSTQTGRLVSPAPLTIGAHPTPLPTAIRQAVSLGPAGSATEVYMNLGLKGRDPDRLAALLAAGQTVTPAEYAAQFGPDPTEVEAAVDLLKARGFRVTWSPGSGLIAVDGPATAAASLLDVTINNYR